MTINITQEVGKLTIEPIGRLDTTTAPKFQESLIPSFEKSKIIVLDLKQLTYISSAGLRVLLIGQKLATSKNASMQLINVSEEIIEVLDMTGFSDILTIL
jgi:anti-anti-sigma factor